MARCSSSETRYAYAEALAQWVLSQTLNGATISATALSNAGAGRHPAAIWRY